MKTILLIFILAMMVSISACNTTLLDVKEKDISIESMKWVNLPASCAEVETPGRYGELKFQVKSTNTECQVNNLKVDDGKETGYFPWKTYEAGRVYTYTMLADPFEYNPIKICCRHPGQEVPGCTQNEFPLKCRSKDQKLQ